MPKEKDFYQVSLKAFIINADGKLLALKAVDTGSIAGFYDLPGGRIDTEEFETPYVIILKREITEELGENLDVEIRSTPVAVGRHLIPARLSRAGKDVRVLMVFFEAYYQGGDFMMSSEHKGMEWLNLKTINPEEYFTSGILQGVRMFLASDRRSVSWRQ